MDIDLRQFLHQPLAVGGRQLRGRLALAPMTYLGHVAFRELLAGFGGYGLLFSEMCSAKRLPRENAATSAFFRWRPEELPHLVCQIFGADPEVMAAAAVRVAQEGFFGVDINLGCSVSAICRQNCGAALLRQPARAAAIVAAVRKAVPIPLFVKYRTGWQDDPAAAVDLARRFEAAGADALTFHPRVAPDRRGRPPKWDYIRQVKAAVTIPVFGNGNVFDAEDCRRMIASTGCDGVVIGRMAIARPWIFAEIADGLRPGPEVFARVALEMVRLLEHHYDPVRALRRFKRWAQYFSANFPFGHTLYTRLINVDSLAAAAGCLREFLAGDPVPATRPNMNFMR